MKEKTKKYLVMAGLIAVGILLVAGISMRLYKEQRKELPTATESTEATEVVVDTETGENPKTEEIEETEQELVIEMEEKTDIDPNSQNLQSDPVKTEDEKPSEAPPLAENTDVENEAVTPEYKEEATAPVEQSSTTTSGTPYHGQTKDGMIYIDGFGWVTDEGGGGVGTVAEDMYENGNKIGIMD